MSDLLAWHFVGADRRVRAFPPSSRPDHLRAARSHAGRLVTPGLTLRVEGPPLPGQWGLHAGFNPAEAVLHAPSLVVCRVRMGGEIVQAERYAVATERTVLWMADATATVFRWALLCTAEALAREEAAGRPVNPIFWEAAQVRYRLLRGQPAEEAREALRLPVLAAMRQVCGLAADYTRRSAGQHPDAQHAAVLAAGCCADWSRRSYLLRMFARRPGWFDTPIARAENAALEAALCALEPQGVSGRREGVCCAG